MGNRWQEIWNRKGKDFEIQDLDGTEDEFAVYSVLKKLDGFDVNVRGGQKHITGVFTILRQTCGKQ